MRISNPEFEFLVLLSRPGITELESARVRDLLGRPLDWQLFLVLAQRHRVLPLVSRNLCGFAERIPPDVAAAIRSAALEIANSNLHAVRTLLELVATAQSVDIRAIPYKGPTLALEAYGDIALRSFVDIDVLIAKKDLSRLRRELVRKEYSETLGYSRSLEQRYLRTGAEFPLRSPGGVLVELQWQVVPRYFALEFNFDNLWQRRRPLKIAGQSVSQLSPEDLLVVLCVHGGKHKWERLAWISDVAALISNNVQLDWGYIRSASRNLGASRAVLLGLELSGRLFGVPMPREARALGRDRTALALAQQVEAQSLASTIAPDSAPDGRLSFHQVAFLWRLRERLRDRMTFAIRLLFTPSISDWRLVDLPSPFSSLYYPIRIGRLFWRALHRSSTDETGARGSYRR